MDRVKKAVSALIPVIILISCVVGSFISADNITKSVPENPLIAEAKASCMYTSQSVKTKLENNGPDNFSKADINTGNGNSDSDNNDSNETSEYADTERKNNSDEHNGDGVYIYNTNAENDYNSVSDDSYEKGRSNNNSGYVHKPESAADSSSARANSEHKDNIPLAISTTLTDTVTDKSILCFNAIAVPRGNVYVTCNGREVLHNDENLDDSFLAGTLFLSWSDNYNNCPDYITQLNKGDNIIVVSAESNGESARETYTVTYLDDPQLYIDTDLSNCTVYESGFEFYASILNGSADSYLDVYVNGEQLQPAYDTKYSARLSVGQNTIRLRAVSTINREPKTINQTYRITYIPQASEETKPRIASINIADNMTVRGNDLTLNILAQDMDGNRIYHGGIDVALNGVRYGYKWDSNVTSYRLWLEQGENRLDIRLTDRDGRYWDYSYNINCESARDGEQIGEITVSVDANVLGLGYIVSPVNVPIYQGENLARTVARFLEDRGFAYSGSGDVDEGFYLARISKSGIASSVNIPTALVDEINADGLEWKTQRYKDSVGEHDYCQGSGWMYSVNDIFSGNSLSDDYPKNGDVLKIRYTLAYGKDIGGYNSGNAGEHNYSRTW